LIKSDSPVYIFFIYLLLHCLLDKKGQSRHDTEDRSNVNFATTSMNYIFKKVFEHPAIFASSHT